MIRRIADWLARPFWSRLDMVLLALLVWGVAKHWPLIGFCLVGVAACGLGAVSDLLHRAARVQRDETKR